MTEFECLDAIVYLCSKLGIEVVDHRTNQQRPRSIWSANAAGRHALSLDISVDVLTSRSKIRRSVAQTFLNAPRWFEWSDSKIMLPYILMSRTFTPSNQDHFTKRWAIGNPFFNHFELCKVASLAEFMLLADLVCPEDKTLKVLEFIKRCSKDERTR